MMIMKNPRPIGNSTQWYEGKGLCKMVRVCMVVMQKFGVNEMCPGYNARKYEKQEERGERKRKPTVESERYYTPPEP